MLCSLARTRRHLRLGNDLALETGQDILALAVEFDADEGDDRPAELGGIDERHVAGDHPELMQASNATQARRGRQSDPLGEVEIGDLIVLLQDVENFQVDPIEVDRWLFFWLPWQRHLSIYVRKLPTRHSNSTTMEYDYEISSYRLRASVFENTLAGGRP